MDTEYSHNFSEFFFNYKKVDNLNEKIVEHIANHGMNVEFFPNYEHLQTGDISVMVSRKSEKFFYYNDEEYLPYDALLNFPTKFEKNNAPVTYEMIECVFGDDKIKDPTGTEEYSHVFEIRTYHPILKAYFPICYLSALMEIYGGIIKRTYEEENQGQTVISKDFIDKESINRCVTSLEYIFEPERFHREFNQVNKYVEFKGWDKFQKDPTTQP